MESCKIPVMERKQQCPSSYFFPTLPNQEVEKASGDDDTYAPLSGKKTRAFSSWYVCKGMNEVKDVFAEEIK